MLKVFAWPVFLWIWHVCNRYALHNLWHTSAPEFGSVFGAMFYLWGEYLIAASIILYIPLVMVYIGTRTARYRKIPFWHFLLFGFVTIVISMQAFFVYERITGGASIPFLDTIINSTIWRLPFSSQSGMSAY